MSVTEVPLKAGWVFQKGDNLDWKNPDLDDSDWLSILPTGYWDYMPDLEDYDGYGWYRVHVYIPSSLKKDASTTDSLHIRLGRIDDNDQTFLNGLLIGENSRNISGEGNPGFAGEEMAYSWPRDYTLPLSHPAILWDKVNVIAVRAYDFYLTGGLTSSDFRVFVRRNWSDYVTFKRQSNYLSRLRLGVPFTVEFLASNSADVDFEVDFFTEITLKESGESIFASNQKLSLGANSDIKPSVSFIPNIKTDYEITYRLTNAETGQTLVDKEMLGFFLPDVKLLDKPIAPSVADKVPVKYLPPEFPDVKVKGLLGEKMALNLEKGLLNIPYQQVHPHIDDIEPPWPVGEFIGKLLHGNTKGLQYTRDERLLETTAAVIEIWLRSQDEDGYLGTNLPEERWEGWDVWDHKYLMLAFIHYYAITGYEPAIEGAEKIGNLLINSFGYGEGQRDLMLGYHKGMASGSVLEPMVYLYKYTAKKRYLDFCRFILKAYEQENGPKIISELTEGSKTVLKVGNAKGYEMLSCLIGLVQMYKVTGQQDLIEATLNAWDDIQNNRLYITGTSTRFEHFQEVGYLPAEETDHMGETCVTAHWMYFSKELFKLFGEQKYLDEMEKSLYNHLLAAQHPISGDVVYYSAYQDKKWYMIPDMYIGPPLCCHFSFKRCITEVPEFSFYKSGAELGVALYNQTEAEIELSLKKNKRLPVRLSVQSDYPVSADVKIVVDPGKKVDWTLALRVPDWCKSFKATVGKDSFEGTPGEFLKITRKWKSKETVEISMDRPIRVLAGGESYPNHMALKFGNLVLAVDGAVNSIHDLEEVRFDSSVEPDIRVSEAKMPEGWVGNLAYESNAVVTKSGKPVILVPYADASQTGGDIRVWIKQK